MNLIEAAKSGDRRAILESLRDLLAVSLVDADADKRGPLAKQLRDTVAELEAMPTGKEVSTSDDLSSKRVARLAAAKASMPAAAADL